MIFSIFLLLGSVAFGVARFVVPVRGLDFRDTFKDMAHLWVGFLIGVAVCYSPFCWESDGVLCFGVYNWHWWVLPVGLTVLEVVAALVRKPKA